MTCLTPMFLILGLLSTPAMAQLIDVPAGSFTQGLNSEAEKRAFSGPNLDEFKADRLPTRKVTMSAFQIGKFEVTNEEYIKMPEGRAGERVGRSR